MRLAAVCEAREDWLAQACTALASRPFTQAAWLVGSLGRGHGDAFSDIDLVVVTAASTTRAVLADPWTELELPGRVLFIRPKPRNAPAGGAYQAVCLELAGLPVIVDLYLWPAQTAAVPVGSRVLFSAAEPPRTELAFMALLDRHRTSDTRGADPTAPETALLLTQLAAKYLARGDQQRLAGIRTQLGIPAAPGIAALRHRLTNGVDVHTHPNLPAVTAAAQLLTLADTVAHRPAADTFTRLVATVHALTRRFPDHNGPFERLSRLLEEAGELAQQVNHAEGTGAKVAKYGPFDRANLVKEIEDVLRTAIGIATHYDLVDDVRASIAAHYADHVASGLIDPPPNPAGEGQRGDD